MSALVASVASSLKVFYAKPLAFALNEEEGDVVEFDNRETVANACPRGSLNFVLMMLSTFSLSSVPLRSASNEATFSVTSVLNSVNAFLLASLGEKIACGPD